jgi:hypothetical protein
MNTHEKQLSSPENQDQQKVQDLFEGAKRNLKLWGVTDLSLIEQVEIRNVARDVINAQEAQKKEDARQEANLDRESYFDYLVWRGDQIIQYGEFEVIYRWLARILGTGLTRKDINRYFNHVVQWMEGGEKNEKSFTIRDDALDFERSLRKKHMEPQRLVFIDPAFKEYIARVRDRMHNPEMETYKPPVE